MEFNNSMPNPIVPLANCGGLMEYSYSTWLRGDHYIWRYLRPSWLSSKNPSFYFSLRDNPPEPFVSFFHSTESDENQQIKKVIICIKERLSISSKSGLLKLDMQSACDSLNDDGDVVSFTDEDYPHIGLVYEPEKIEDLAEFYSILLMCSSVYQRTKSGDYALESS